MNPTALLDVLLQISNHPFDRESFKYHDWRLYQFLQDLGLIDTRYGFSTITPLGCLFLANHG